MENQTDNGHGDHKGWCMTCHGHKSPWHWVIKIVILIIVFWLGVKIGELKMLFREAIYPSYYGGYMMQGWVPNSGWNGTMGRMMNGWWYGGPQSTTTNR